MLWTMALLLSLIGGDAKQQLDAKRVVFLGDSITYDGRYIAAFEAEYRLKFPGQAIEFLNIGLPSETCSGLSEDGHAGGKFPRPTVHERLDRVLAKVKPDLVFACYGMNDGIYLPFKEERFAKFQTGLKDLRTKVLASGAKLIHLTPALFDGHPIRKRLAPADKVDANHPYEGYGKVLDRYSEWLIAQRAHGWKVIDLHGPMQAALDRNRKSDVDFTYAPDGVHPNLAGQLVLGQALWNGLQLGSEFPTEAYADTSSIRGKLFGLTQQRMRILCDAWLTETRHLRPGMAKGLPLAEAETKSADLAQKMQELVESK